MRRLANCACLSFACVLLFVLPAEAQVGKPPQNQTDPKKGISYQGSGTELFRALLNLSGITPIKEQQARTLKDYQDVIVIVVGDLHRSRLNPLQPFDGTLQNPISFAKNALASGGSVLIASESAFEFTIEKNNADNTVLSKGLTVFCDHPSSHFAASPDCPFAAPLEKPNFRWGDRQAAVRKLFGGDGEADSPRLNRVVAGAASVLALDTKRISLNLQPLARFPENSYVGIPPNGKLGVRGTDYFAIGGEIPSNQGHHSHCLVFSSSMVFNNYLLFLVTNKDAESRADNYELCRRAIDFLQGPSQTRKRCLFFDRGQIVERFDDLAVAVIQQMMPVPQININELQSKAIDIANRSLEQAQQNGLPDRLFSNASPSIIRWICLLLLSLFGCWFLLRRLLASGKPGNLPPPPAVAVATTGPPGVFERRQRELIRRNNLYEPVRDLIREFFASLGINGEQGPKLPKLRISDEVHRPQSLRLALKDLWRLAYGPPQVMDIKRWSEMEPYFERLRQAHADGKWWFILANKSEK